MSKKFSQFTAKDTVADSDYVNVTGSGVNRRVSWPDFLDNIYDRIVTPFIYPTIVALQEAPLRADEDDPVYVRVEETEYRLYKITNIAPGVNDITLDNGNTATAQSEYRDKVDSGPIADALALKADLESPEFTGNPTAPTPAADDDSESIATTQYVQVELSDRIQSVATISDLGAMELPVGSALRTLGAVIVGTGGADYIVESPAGTPDGFARVLLANGNHAVLQPVNGEFNLRQFGAIGNGTTDDSAAIARAFAFGQPLTDGGGIYRSVSTTITASHPFSFSGAGQGKTVFRFVDMGGLTGDDCFFISVAPEAPFLSQTRMSGFTIEVTGDDAKSGIATQRGSITGGSIWNIIRPTYLFEQIDMRGGVKLTSSSQSLYDYGCARYFDVGDSSCPIFRQIRINGIYQGDDDSSDARVIEALSTVGFYTGGSDSPAGGAAFMPLIENCSTEFVGQPVMYGRRNSNQRIVNSQFHRSGWGIVSDDTLANPDVISEAQFDNLNINASYGGIDLDLVSFLDATNVRCTRSAGHFDHGQGWTGIRMVGGGTKAMVNLTNVRALDAQTGTPLTGDRIGYSISDIDEVNINSAFIEDRSGGAFEKGIKLLNVGKINISGVLPNGSVVDLIDIDSTAASEPYISLQGVTKTADVTNRVVYGANVELSNLSDDAYAQYQGVGAVVAISSAGSETLLPKLSGQVQRRGFSAGASPYTYDINLSNEGASPGDMFKINIQTNSTSGSNFATVNIKDAEGTTQFTVVQTASATRYCVEMVFCSTTSDGTAWRAVSAHQSLATAI